MEIWKDVKNYEGLYQISNYGNIKSIGKKSKNSIINYGLIKPQKTIYGYLQVLLWKNGKPTSKRIHRLVMEAFKPVENMEKLQVNHINYNRIDNRLENLEWTTPKQNCNKKVPKKDFYNSCKCIDSNGKIWNSYREAARYYKIAANTVKRDVLGLTNDEKLKNGGKKKRVRFKAIEN